MHLGHGQQKYTYEQHTEGNWWHVCPFCVASRLGAAISKYALKGLNLKCILSSSTHSTQGSRAAWWNQCSGPCGAFFLFIIVVTKMQEKQVVLTLSILLVAKFQLSSVYVAVTFPSVWVFSPRLTKHRFFCTAKGMDLFFLAWLLRI